eukprot:7035970-Lingulodinium_polyedra.AAC.1
MAQPALQDVAIQASPSQQSSGRQASSPDPARDAPQATLVPVVDKPDRLQVPRALLAHVEGD